MISNVECIGRHCVYDNEKTWRREWWVNGRISQIATREMIEYAFPEAIQHYRLGPPWESGRIIGDPAAMQTTIQKVAHRGDK